jgi:hypothetical protein
MRFGRIVSVLCGQVADPDPAGTGTMIKSLDEVSSLRRSTDSASRKWDDCQVLADFLFEQKQNQQRNPSSIAICAVDMGSLQFLKIVFLQYTIQQSNVNFREELPFIEKQC